MALDEILLHVPKEYVETPERPFELLYKKVNGRGITPREAEDSKSHAYIQKRRKGEVR